MLCDLGETDNLPILQAMVDHLGDRGGGTLQLPASRRHFRCDGTIRWRSGVSLRGQGAAVSRLVQPTGRLPLIDITGVRGARFDAIAMEGSGLASEPDRDYASAIHGVGDSADIAITRCEIRDWHRAGVAVDGIDGLEISNCVVERTYSSGGVVISKGQMGRRIRITGNRITKTQFGNLHAWGPVSDIFVSENYLDESGWQGGDYRQGNVADNITLYNDARNQNIIIRSNICLNSGENGIHAAADGLVIEGNVIRSPKLYGIIASHKPYERPDPFTQVSIRGNIIECVDASDPDSRGIGLRNCEGFLVADNQIVRAHMGIEILGQGEGLSARSGLVTGNILRKGGACALLLRGGGPILIARNFWQADTFCMYEDRSAIHAIEMHNSQIAE